MGQGKDVIRNTIPKPQSNLHIQERGEIFFFFRPKVGKEEAHSPDDVQRLYLVLRPESSTGGGQTSIEQMQQNPPHSTKQDKPAGGKERQREGGHGSQDVNIEKQPLLRFIVMGKKSLPDPTKKSTPFWGFVEMVTTNPNDIKNALKGEEYDTSTKGHRHNSPARALGEGIYRILKHGNGKDMHTHLVYKLEFPPEDVTTPNEPQESLNVEREASFILQIKNPNQKGGTSGRFRGLGEKRKATFPAKLQGEFGRLRYSPADPPDFLNYEGCEFLLISASDDIEEELGLELRTDESCSDLVEMFGETAATDPLFKGTWV